MSTQLPGVEVTTIEQLARLARSDGRYELVRGELRMMPPADGRHGQVAMRCGRFLANHVETHGLGVVYAAETGGCKSTICSTSRRFPAVKADRGWTSPGRGLSGP